MQLDDAGLTTLDAEALSEVVRQIRVSPPASRPSNKKAMPGHSPLGLVLHVLDKRSEVTWIKAPKSTLRP